MEQDGQCLLSQVLTASFVPLLSKFQDNDSDFRRYVTKINRFTAFVLFPALLGLAAVGTSLFHTLFGDKWDPAIILFQILCVRGIFVVLISLYGNYMLSKGYGKRLFVIEIVKDSSIALAIAATIFSHDIELLVWGQLAASILTWIIIIILTGKAIGYSPASMTYDLFPFAISAIIMCCICWFVSLWSLPAIATLLLQVTCGGLTYIIIMWKLHFPELREATSYLFGRFRRKKVNPHPHKYFFIIKDHASASL